VTVRYIRQVEVAADTSADVAEFFRGDRASEKLEPIEWHRREAQGVTAAL